MLLLRLIFILTIALAFSTQAKEILPGPVNAFVIEVKDGDTLEIAAHVWLGQRLITQVRLNGVDTPERRGKCPTEKAKAQAATYFLEELVASGEVTLHNISYGKYAGRVLADVHTSDGEDVSHSLIEAGHARAYDGGKRQSWCDTN